MIDTLVPVGLTKVFGQHIEIHDFAIVGLLVVLEGVLSIDNALVLGILARRLPRHQQRKALTYGLVGAFVFRFTAIAMAQYLFRWWVVKLLGGMYLLYVALKRFLFESRKAAAQGIAIGPDGHAVLENPAEPALPVVEAASGRHPGFWSTVAVIEMTDIAFAVDSILAAVALVGSPPPGHDAHALHPKFWVVITGGFLGVVAMRYAAVLFIRLLEHFPRFETAAYLLVMLIGCKLLADWYFNYPPAQVAGATQPATMPWHPPLDFHSPRSPAFFVFWGLMVVFFCTGFLPQRKAHSS